MTQQDNLIINPDFRVAKRGVTFTAETTPANNSGAYLLDRWVLLSDGDNVVRVDQDTSVAPVGAYASAKLTVMKPGRRFGLLTILEARDSAAVIDGRASLSFQARTSAGATIGNLRAAVLAWSGEADFATASAVVEWGGDVPALASGWSAAGTSAPIPVSGERFHIHALDGVSLDAPGMKNVAVFIWTDSPSSAAGDALYLGNVKLNPGGAATPFMPRPYGEEMYLCGRYYGSTRGLASTDAWISIANGVNYPIPMRAPPVLSTSLYDGTGANYSQEYDHASGLVLVYQSAGNSIMSSATVTLDAEIRGREQDKPSVAGIPSRIKALMRW